MNERSRKPRRPRDLNKLAVSITKTATWGDRELEDTEKNIYAVTLGRMGGLKRGKARAEKLSREERSQIARKAPKARWAKRKK